MQLQNLLDVAYNEVWLHQCVSSQILEKVLGIEGWQTIDTSGTVWYTENEESEECPWRVKF